MESEQCAGRLASMEQASKRLCEEVASEHQQTRLSAVGLATELAELRAALAKESEAYQASTSSVERWIRETVQLKQALQEEELYRAIYIAIGYI